MKKRTTISYESSVPLTGTQIIAAIQQIQQDAKDLGWATDPHIETHGNDGIHKVVGFMVGEVEL